MNVRFCNINYITIGNLIYMWFILIKNNSLRDSAVQKALHT